MSIITEMSETILREKFDALTIPAFCTWELTNVCNFHCTHCFNRVDARCTLPFEDIKTIAEKLKRAGVVNIALTGGEPLTRKDIIPIINYLSELGFSLQVFTNASLITEEFLSAVKNSNISRYEISVYGATPETYEKITKNKKAYDMVCRGLTLLKKQAVPYYAKAMAMKSNYFELEKMYEFAKNYGCLVNGNTAQEFANPRIFAQTHNQRAERLSDEELYNFYMNVNELHGRGGMHCSAGMSEIGIKANGIVVPCITWRNCELGSILKEDLSVILQSNQTCKVREYDYSRLKCAKCEHLPYCDPCPMVFSYETGDEYIPATESCRIACVRHRVQDLRRIE